MCGRGPAGKGVSKGCANDERSAAHLGLVDHTLRLPQIRLTLQVPADGRDRAGESWRRRLRTGRLDLVLHPDLVGVDLVVDVGEVLLVDVLAVVNAAVILDKLDLRHRLLDLRVVRVRVEEDDGEGEDVSRVGVGKDAWVAGRVSLGKLEHVPIDLLRLAGQAERLKEHAQRVDEQHVVEVHEVDEGMHRGDVLGLSVGRGRSATGFANK